MKGAFLIFFLWIYAQALFAQQLKLAQETPASMKSGVGAIPTSGPKLVLPVGHTGNISGTSISMDGKYMLSFGEGADVFLWETSSGKLIHTYHHELASMVRSVEFSPNGDYFFSISNTLGNNLTVWNVKTGEKKIIDSYNDLPFFSPDSRFFIVNTYSIREPDFIPYTIEVFDMQSGKLFLRKKFEEGKNVFIKEKKIFVVDKDSLHQWDYKMNKAIGAFKVHFHYKRRDSTKDFELEVVRQISINGNYLRQVKGDSTYVYSLTDGRQVFSYSKKDDITFDYSGTGKFISWITYDLLPKYDSVHFFDRDTKNKFSYPINHNSKSISDSIKFSGRIKSVTRESISYLGNLNDFYSGAYIYWGGQNDFYPGNHVERNSYIDYSFKELKSGGNIQTTLIKRNM